jgi:hypothetical protein
MNITVTKENGKSVGRVHAGDRVLYVTPRYLTNQMALADAHCWRVFHGEEAKMSETEVLPNVALTPDGVETLTRQAYYGTPHYFGKVEWFDVLDRETDEMLTAWRVSRVDGGEVVVNGPQGYVITGVTSLRAACELISTKRDAANEAFQRARALGHDHATAAEWAARARMRQEVSAV